ncbi:MAG: hypothetical protein JWQ11_562 [Rhizobacter sp.]|nr:hypothetical protein [Rhizobacter sp.]
MTTIGPAPTTRPLDGIRVLDFTIMMAGPYCTRYLADLGAEVIKVESAEGDYIRSREPLRDGHSAYFGHLNAGKQSVVLDLKSAAGLDAARRLAQQCDVLVENFRPGVMQRLGLDYASLAEANPRLVYCSISGFGQTGPSSQRPAYAQIVQAASGYDAAFAGYQDTKDTAGDASARPPNNAIFLADVLGGTYAFAGVLAALNHRHATGRGQHVDITLIECMLNLMPYEVQEAQFPMPQRRPVYPPLRTSDGWLMISAVSPKNFEALFPVIGIDDWRDDPTLATNAARQANWLALMAKVETWTSSRSTADCEATFSKAGFPATGYRSVKQAIDDPQMTHRGSMARVHDGGGEQRVPNLPFRLSDAKVEVGARVPALGEHTQQVLSEMLGLDAAAIEAAGGRVSAR